MDVETIVTFKYIIVGGGISAVSTAEQIRSLGDTGNILIISEADVVQAADKINRITVNLEDFLIVEKTFENFKDQHENIFVVQDSVENVDVVGHAVMTRSGKTFSYCFLCICTGASPNVITFEYENYNFSKHILSLRDFKSVAEVSKQLSKSNRILVVGNGGIATEFIYEAQNVGIVWSIKDSSISSHYFDAGAACFLLKSQKYLAQFDKDATTENPSRDTQSKQINISKRKIYKLRPHIPIKDGEQSGSALGPDWHNEVILKGLAGSKSIDIEYGTEIKRLFSTVHHLHIIKKEFDEEIVQDAENWPVYVELTNGKKFGVDWILSATGVTPNCKWFPGLKDDNNGIFVNGWMHTSCEDIFAAGDVCMPCWPKERHWFQMRLWGQARTMGQCAGYSMTASADVSNSDHIRAKSTPSFGELISKTTTKNEMFGGFDIFTHITKFFGFKVVLLGSYNGQDIPEEEQVIQLRVTPNVEYIKVVMQNNRVQGAILVGDTGLEETLENLILTQLDISALGEDALLNPSVDLEDYFD